MGCCSMRVSVCVCKERDRRLKCEFANISPGAAPRILHRPSIIRGSTDVWPKFDLVLGIKKLSVGESASKGRLMYKLVGRAWFVCHPGKREGERERERREKAPKQHLFPQNNNSIQRQKVTLEGERGTTTRHLHLALLKTPGPPH